MNIHHDSFMRLEELGARIPSYYPTFDFAGAFINESHEYYSACPIRDGILIEIKDHPSSGSVIEGWLRREDSLKLYEIAYCVAGDILELGSYHGLSTSILSRANADSPNKKNIYSVDLAPDNVAMTNHHLRRMELDKHVTTICGDALSVVKQLASRGARFEFVFVDHSHSYEAVYSVCRELGTVMVDGGFCLFHDFNDGRNREADDAEYGVYQGVVEGLDSREFEFYGVYGCAALYRFHAE